MTKQENQDRLNQSLRGNYILYQGKYVGICKNIELVGPPSGWGATTTVHLHDGTSFTADRPSDLQAVDAAGLQKIRERDAAERQRKLDLIWRKVGAEYRGLSTDGQRSIMRWAKYGSGLINLADLPDAEVEDMASFYARGK